VKEAEEAPRAAVDADLRQRLCSIYWDAGVSQTDVALMVG
jgi:hypothetical protein